MWQSSDLLKHKTWTTTSLWSSDLCWHNHCHNASWHPYPNSHICAHCCYLMENMWLNSFWDGVLVEKQRSCNIKATLTHFDFINTFERISWQADVTAEEELEVLSKKAISLPPFPIPAAAAISKVRFYKPPARLQPSMCHADDNKWHCKSHYDAPSPSLL